MPKPDPLKERERLLREGQAAVRAADEANARLRQLEVERTRMDARRLGAYESLARGQKDAQAEVDQVEADRAELLAQIDRTQTALDGAGRARQTVERELGDLIINELDAFAEEAERYTREALEALAALEQPYRAAHAAWMKATSVWRPLLPALAGAVTTADHASGVWRDARRVNASVQVPDWPLMAPHALYATEHAPRPAALQPTQPNDDVIEEVMA